jgi:hypothetical protein
MKFNKTWDIAKLTAKDVTTEVYFTMSEATRAPNYFVFQDLTQQAYIAKGALLDTAMTANHAVLGLMSENVELLDAMNKHDYVNVAEELTDMDWYGAALGRVLYPTMEALVAAHDFPTRPYFMPQAGISVIFSLMADAMKRYMYYKPVSEWGILMESQHGADLREQLSTLWASLSQIRSELGISVSESRYKNLAKLHKRFGHKFDSFLAYNRNLDAERKILEG